ncbi:DUF2917 domain-containing protein [Chitinibacter sp. FCG-7]|uniref:DUF2917 domain-containing protein n=1 Tax=Chitinibacter mangrovi TaxID=3153927 RepID=A0AAU7F9V7_9NEIS
MHAFQLPQASLSTLNGHAQQWIECEQGMIWLSDDGHDVVLERGQRWQIRSDNTVVIEAFAHSRIKLEQEAGLVPGVAQAAKRQLQQFLQPLLQRHNTKTA